MIDLSRYRPNVGLALFNREGLVWVGRRAGDMSPAIQKYRWQLPQGGIDTDETPEQAALRELEEEIGTSKAEILGRTADWLVYTFPAEVRAHQLARKKKDWLGQKQIWYALRFTGTDADIHVDTDHPEFDDWKWLPLNDVVDLIVPFKRRVYLEMVTAFHQYAGPHK